MHAPWRLGLDIGTNSLGWCVIDLNRDMRPRAIRRLGVRIFPDGRDPQSGTSLAVERRGARAQRRRRDRYLDRRSDLLRALIRHGLMPDDPSERKNLEALDPYELRTRGLDEALSLPEFGRALFHLNQRRGFKSNRKTERAAGPEKDADKQKEVQGMKDAAVALERRIAETGCRTVGEYLYRTAREGRSVRGSKDGTVEGHLPVRARPHTVKGRNAYDFYPTRAMYEAEFDALWKAQSGFHPELSETARAEIRDIIFFQRPLKPVDPGKCTLDPTDQRAPLALPIVQQFRILQELANLRLENPVTQELRSLTLAERDLLFEELCRKDKLTFAGVRQKKRLGLSRDWRINLEDARREYLKGDTVSAALGRAECFGEPWFGLPESRQTEIVSFLLDEPEEDAVVARATAECGLDEAQARAVSKVSLPVGYGRIGLRALRRIVPIMREEADERGEPLHYSEAAERAGCHHSDFRTGEIFDALPYYGEVLSRYVADIKSPTASPEERTHGRIANPTVHIGLNETRKLVNKLIERYGHPAEIVVELARELKLNKEQKDRVKKQQAENRKKNEERRRKLEEIGETHRADGLLRLRLWEELGENPAERRCVYTGEQISIKRLFSDEIEIEHILPFQDSLDDSAANLTVSLRASNRDKGKRTPFEAFGHTPQWDDIIKRSASLPGNKRWRFRADAMDLVCDRTKRDLARMMGELPKEVIEDIERTGGFLARQLVDTAYLARVARQYLWSVCDPDRVRVVPGRLTEFLRRKWGLNRLLYGNLPDPDEDGATSGPVAKRRDDHRHHAIDAFVVGMTELSMLQRVSTAAARAKERLIEEMPEPWQGFRDDLKQRLDRLVVSHRPDHRTQGQLHQETAYGVIGDPDMEDGANLVFRKPEGFISLTMKEIARIRDQELRSRVTEYVIMKLPNEKDRKGPNLKKVLAAFAQEDPKHRGIRRVRLLWKEAKIIAINHGRRCDGQPHNKAYLPGENHRVEIFSRPDRTWGWETISFFDTNKKGFRVKWPVDYPDGRLVMRLLKNDFIKLRHDGAERIMRVVSIWQNQVVLAEQYEAGNLDKRDKDNRDPFKLFRPMYSTLKARQARKVHVDILGRVHDPGPPA